MASGTIRSCSIDGLTYAVKADADVSMKLSKYTTERIPTSSGSFQKKTKIIQTIENVTLGLGGLDRDNLRRSAEKQEDIPMSLTDAGGNTYSCYGSFDIESWTSQDDEVTVTLQAADEWTFLAA